MNIPKDFFEQDPLSLGTKGLIFIGENVLVYRRDGNTTKMPFKIDLPGGGKENIETPLETFVRECFEEFGLTIDRGQITYAKRYESTVENGKFGWFCVAKLPPEAKNKIKFGDEGLEYMIISVQKYLEAIDAWDIFQNRTRDYLSSLAKINPVLSNNLF